MQKVISTDKAPSAIGPYSQAIEINNMVYTSGVIPVIPATGEIAEGGVEAQAEQVCANIEAVLKKAGADMEAVVKTTCFLTDMENFAAFNEIYGKHFISKPARSCVSVLALPAGALCEVEVIAHVK